MARLIYFCLRALRHLVRNPVVSGVTVGTVSIVFLILVVFGLVGHNLDRLVERLQLGLKMVIYLEDGASQAQRDDISRQLSESSLVASVAFVGREQALERFRTRLGANSNLLDGVEDNPLPASLEACLSPQGRSSQAVSTLAQQVIGLPGVEQVQYGQAWLDRFFDVLRLARMAGLLIGSLIVFATLLIVSNTIRLSVFARRDEIHILKLVGATDRFVKAPFYIEGIVLGTVGAGVGVALAWLLFQLVHAAVHIPLGPSEADLALAFLPGPTIVAVILGGAALGLLGTLTSLWRHLRI